MDDGTDLNCFRRWKLDEVEVHAEGMQYRFDFHSWFLFENSSADSLSQVMHSRVFHALI